MRAGLLPLDIGAKFVEVDGQRQLGICLLPYLCFGLPSAPLFQLFHGCPREGSIDQRVGGLAQWVAGPLVLIRVELTSNMVEGRPSLARLCISIEAALKPLRRDACAMPDQRVGLSVAPDQGVGDLRGGGLIPNQRPC